ncbi:MAG: serpin family protein [Desulfitobacteriia bacterium]
MVRKIGTFLIAVLFMFLLTACSEGGRAENKKYNIEEISEEVIEGNNQFAFEIFKKLNNEDTDKSIFISPISISTALTMTYNGAESSTKEGMEKALGFEGLDRDIVNKSFSNLLNYLPQASEKIELNLANSIWIREGEEIKKDFLEKNESNFRAKIETLDFSKDSAVAIINKWIAKETKGKIEEMLDPPIDPRVIMYLINAIYFQGEWSKEFDPRDTSDSTFHTYDGGEQTVEMMSRQDKFLYTEKEDFKALKLPYGKGEVAMYLLLPEQNIDINEFIQGLSGKTWEDIRKSVVETDDVFLNMPKFKLEYGIKNLNTCLEELGMSEALSDRADFSGIREDIFISRVLHKAVLEVDEKGSKAAGATVVEMREVAAVEPITFIADRPFVFIISEETTKSILFMGKLLKVE